MLALRNCSLALIALPLFTAVSCNKTETKATIHDYIPPGYYDLDVSIFPKGQTIAMSYGIAQEITEKAVTETVKDSFKFTCLPTSDKMLTFYWDPSPEGVKTDVSDWQELAVITLPSGKTKSVSAIRSKTRLEFIRL
ncbi:MAG: hypothetical protein EOP07_21290 [Proteobacteria bacterium]|nr:MAG: hypothetical protein EOP07_21290 [Pseudomonadota bacterium]